MAHSNYNIENRQKLVNIAKKNDYNVIYIWFKIPIVVSKYLNEYRTQLLDYHIPNVAYNVYNKKFIEPTIEENIDSIIVIEKIFGLRNTSHIFNYLF